MIAFAKKFWRFFIIVFFAVAIGFFWIKPALANGGPHGGFTSTTDACAGCHRSHSAKTSGLLVSNEPGLCLSCHDGTGAETNVSDGTYLGAGLRGGGFTNALMDVALDGSAVPASVTSTHIMNGSLGTLWGNGALNSGAGPNYFMICSDCHNPHGENTYRMLRPTPIDSGASSPVIVPDQSTKTYTVSSPVNRYIGEGYGSLGASITEWCTQCHTRYMAGSGSGHTDSGDDIYAFRHNTVSVPCIVCHVSHGTSATMGAYSGAVAWPNDDTMPSGDARSSLLRGNNRAICVTCHVDANGRVGSGGCNSCHDAPPQTGAHLAHSDPSVVGYGMVGSYSNSTAYIFGCGECHPTDSALHRNNIVDVQLSSSGAPAGSLKEKNSSTAAFSGGTCGGVYCHSGEQVSSGPVGNPLSIGPNYILDSHGNFTYAPYTVTISRLYKTTPAWSGGSVSGNCTDCHEFPLTTSVPTVQAGVGDSHQWIDDYGYGNLHAYNMGFEPLACYSCHYGEITTPNTWSRIGDVTTYNPVPLADRTVHVNGQADVIFNTVDPVVYNTFSNGTMTFSLSGATYNTSDKSCGNVACHLGQHYVVWGSPYRWWTNECDLCHRYGLPPAPAFIMSVSPEFAPSSGINSSHKPAIPAGSVCKDCHTMPHGR